MHTASNTCHSGALWIDTHCHLDAAEFAADRNTMREHARQQGVALCVLPAVHAGNFVQVQALAHQWGDAYALGIHPLYVPHAVPDDLLVLEQMLTQHQGDPRLVAVGEIGLDYFVPALCTPAMRARQQHFFVEQLKLAQRFGLPVILHTRRALDAVLHGLRQVQNQVQSQMRNQTQTPEHSHAHRAEQFSTEQNGAAQSGSTIGSAGTCGTGNTDNTGITALGSANIGGIAHAFSGSLQQAQQCLALGLKLGLGGALTYERASRLRGLAATLPLSALVLETDAPDMPPSWLYTSAQQRASGQIQGRNTPAELPRIGQTLADLRGMALQAVCRATTVNALQALPRLAQVARNSGIAE